MELAMTTSTTPRWRARGQRRALLRPASSSVHFQEALRLCRRHQQEELQHREETENEMRLSTEGNGATTDGSESGLNSNNDRGQQQGSPSPPPSERLRTPDHDSPLPDTRAPSAEAPRNESEDGGRRRGSLLKFKAGGDKGGSESRVQWADTSQKDLVREHPRKRYERKPSLRDSDRPKSILKAMQ